MHNSNDIQLKLEELSKKLKETESELALKNDVLENSLNAFDIVNSKGQLVYANKTYLKMWGYSSLEEIIGMPAADHCMDPTIPSKIIETIRQTGECSIEFKARRKDGSSFDVQMWARKAINHQGEEFYPTTSIDITYRNITEERLKAAISARDEFLSIASHELKTPLSALKLRNQLLLRKLRKDHKMDLESLEAALLDNDRLMNRLTQQIGDMLDISRLNSGRFSLHLKRESIVSVLKKAINNFERLYEEENVNLSFNPEDDVTVEIDSLRMEQVLDNILSNALKYGGKKPVKVSLSKESDSILISIHDQGMGIRPDDMERIFEKYERAIPANEVSGMGLGLYISRQIVKMHRGTLEVSSEYGKGSTFMIRLPL